ncbi:hypothetical protein BT96DRAFT_971558 [Gymnopus androsaceus JB14]|uniref:Uncharacterized protein n=1 Tax=Gymnopus androsaceus JB14 TaxID=1447944 RepID=A0A6A4IB85_9AGAR|nr:hypothetical protein BT96DRAFT_971558 [Gymnopus androsaceus JB14]
MESDISVRSPIILYWMRTRLHRALKPLDRNVIQQLRSNMILLVKVVFSLSGGLVFVNIAGLARFKTHCFHPNLDITFGTICLDILQVS